MYDYHLIVSWTESLKNALCEIGKNREVLVRTLRSGLLRNLGGIGRPGLYTVHVGTKCSIEEYVDTALGTKHNTLLLYVRGTKITLFVNWIWLKMMSTREGERVVFR